MPLLDQYARPLRLPPVDMIDEPAIHDAAQELARLNSGQAAAVEKLRQLQREHSRAQEQDAEAYAQAIRDRGKDPGEKRTAAALKQIAGQQRTLDATTRAANGARHDLENAIEQHGAAWAAAIAETEQRRRETLLEATTAVETAHAELAKTINLRTWLVKFPGEPWNPAKSYGTLAGITGPDGSPIGVSAALEALRDMAAGKPAVTYDQRTWRNQEPQPWAGAEPPRDQHGAPIPTPENPPVGG